MECVHDRLWPLHPHHSQEVAERQPRVPRAMLHVTVFPSYRGPKRLYLVSVRQSGTLRHRAGQSRQHNARALTWQFQGPQMAGIDHRRQEHHMARCPDHNMTRGRMDHISRSRLKSGVSSDRTDVSSHLAHVTTHFRTVNGPSSAWQHTWQEESP